MELTGHNLEDSAKYLHLVPNHCTLCIAGMPVVGPIDKLRTSAKNKYASRDFCDCVNNRFSVISEKIRVNIRLCLKVGNNP